MSHSAPQSRSTWQIAAFLCLVLGSGGFVVLCSNLARAEKPAAPAEEKLFDGKTLTGWKKTQFGGEGEVEVKDGELILRAGNPLTGVTWTKEFPKQNYEVTLDAKRVDGSDFFCALTFPVGEAPLSFVVGGWGGGVIGLSSLEGFDASENETTKYQEFESGRWYKIRLRVTADKVEAWIDQKQMVDLETKDRKFSVRAEVELSRPFGIASFATTAAIKNVLVRKLDAK